MRSQEIQEEVRALEVGLSLLYFQVVNLTLCVKAAEQDVYP